MIQSATKPAESGWKTLLSKDFILVLAISCFNQFASLCVKTPINQFGKSLGMAITLLGVVATLQNITKMVSRPIWGKTNDSLDKKKAMSIALCIQIAAYLIYAFTGSIPMFIIGRFVEGISFAVVGTSVYAALGFVVDRRVLGTAMGFYATFPQLVKSFAPVASMAIYSKFGGKYSFLTAAVCTTVSLVLAQFLTFKNVPPRKVNPDVGKKKTSIHDWISVKGLMFLPMLLADGFQNGVLDLVVVVYATELGVPAAGALFFSIQAFVTIFCAIPFGVIQDKFGGKVSVVIAFVCRAAGCFLIAFAPSYTAFVAAGILCGTAKAGNNVMQTDAMKLQPRSRFGIATSTHLLMVDLAVMIGSAVGGVLVDNAGYSVCFAVAGCVLLAGAVFYLILQPAIQKAIQAAAAEEAN